jgi:quercetin dioxygenase-like cupin family protein
MTAAKGLVVSAGGGKHLDMGAPGRFAALKLLGNETNESIMLFEETVPVGTKSLFHLHRDSDEVAWVLAGEITFKIGDEVSVGGPGTCAFFPRNVPHAWKSTGSETGPRLVSLYPGRRWRLRRGALEAPRRPDRRRRTQQTPRAVPLGSRRPQSALSVLRR